MIKKIPIGTRIFLTKKRKDPLYIRPDTTLQNDNLYVAYDVRIDGVTVIPKGTRVIGDWITESDPTIAAQLQIKRIFLDRSGQDLSADSDVIEATTLYNGEEIDNANNLTRVSHYRSTANVMRRIVNVNCCVTTLFDTKLNAIYLEIFTKEIPVTLLHDFIPYPVI